MRVLGVASSSWCSPVQDAGQNIDRRLLGPVPVWPDQLPVDAAQIAHLLARMIHEKCRVNRRLYRWLTALTVLGAVVLTILAVASSAS